MRAVSQFGNTPITEIAIPPVNDGIYQNFSLEPQMVRVRKSNTSFLIISSEDRTDQDDFAPPPVKGQYGMKNGANLLMRKIKRMGASGVYFRYKTPCVNARNNQFRVWRPAKQKWYEFYCEPHYGTDPIALISHMLSMFNSPLVVTWDAPVPVWAATYDPATERFRFYNSLNEYFYVDYNCTAVARGAPLWRIPVIQPTTETPAGWDFVSSKAYNLGPCMCLYTRYVDFHSSSLVKWSKNPNATTLNGANSLLFRVYLDGWKRYDKQVEFPGAYVWYPNLLEDKLHLFSPVWFTMNPDESITSTDIYLTDEFGDELFVQLQFQGIKGAGSDDIPIEVTGPTTLMWDIILEAEI